MRIVYSDQQPPDSWSSAIFLAGPTPRSDNPVPSWRPEALRLLEEAGYDGVVFVPEWSTGKFAGNYNDQVEWEKFGLNCADVIVFWVPRDDTGMPAFTTNVEFGRWVQSGKADLGHPPEAIKMKYLDWLYEDESDGYSHAHLTIEDTINHALDMIDSWWGYSPKRNDRHGGERYVPLQIWTTPAFHAWYTALTSHGNRLEEAQQKWVFQMPKARAVFSWILWVKVWIEAEGRYKENEWIFARSDISCVALYWRPDVKGPDHLYNTEFVLIREFRSPCRNDTDGMVHELPGGSSLKPNQDPKQVASDEVREETSLEIPAEQFRRIGNRQIAATLSTHHAHLYAAPLTDAQMDQARLLASYGTAHGVEEDSERTYVEVRRLRDIILEKDIDWSMIGMIFSSIIPG